MDNMFSKGGKLRAGTKKTVSMFLVLLMVLSTVTVAFTNGTIVRAEDTEIGPDWQIYFQSFTLDTGGTPRQVEGTEKEPVPTGKHTYMIGQAEKIVGSIVAIPSLAAADTPYCKNVKIGIELPYIVLTTGGNYEQVYGRCPEPGDTLTKTDAEGHSYTFVADKVYGIEAKPVNLNDGWIVATTNPDAVIAEGNDDYKRGAIVVQSFSTLKVRERQTPTFTFRFFSANPNDYDTATKAYINVPENIVGSCRTWLSYDYYYDGDGNEIPGRIFTNGLYDDNIGVEPNPNEPNGIPDVIDMQRLVTLINSNLSL